MLFRSDGEEIGVNEFPQISSQVAPDAIAAQPFAEPWIEPSPAMVSGWPDDRAGAPTRNTAALTMPAPSLHLTDVHGHVRPLDDIESEVIRFAIAHYDEQMSEVARRLKIGRSTLYRKLEGLGIDDVDTKVNDAASAG